MKLGIYIAMLMMSSFAHADVYQGILTKKDIVGPYRIMFRDATEGRLLVTESNTITYQFGTTTCKGSYFLGPDDIYSESMRCDDGVEIVFFAVDLDSFHHTEFFKSFISIITTDGYEDEFRIDLKKL